MFYKLMILKILFIDVKNLKVLVSKRSFLIGSLVTLFKVIVGQMRLHFSNTSDS